jgi:hypothetical protein
MSQLQVTGEAKVRDIQGPVVANSGVITALDGAASQYVRGDGTLADFPTSSGGGSSVSYYLNSSVSQGTIGGVAYRELSKEPIIGAGTDIAISTTGYVASYLTDANDPDVLSIPGGNFNCEFYFSVNNNTGNPFFYAELYKYDGTTFTLLGSSVGVPEYINQGTIIAPYYFAIPVATAALALTDRLAIRIYVNVDGRTITLHTENGHLCQVVTTLSKGMVSLNNLTDQSQFITTGTSGTNFAIVSSGDTHTFNLPVASATNTGKLSSTDWSTFNGKVPYTGATGSVDLGFNSLSAKTLTANGNAGSSGSLHLKQNDTINVAGINYGTIATNTLQQFVFYWEDASFAKRFNLDFSLLAPLGTAKTFTLPDLSGTLALLEADQIFTGINSFDNSINYKTGASLANVSGYISQAYAKSGTGTGSTLSLKISDGNSVKAINLNFVGTPDTYTYTFPDFSGTVALTSQLTFLPLTGGIMTGSILLNNNIGISGQLFGTSTYSGMLQMSPSNKVIIDSGSQGVLFGGTIGQGAFTYSFPSASGTLALTSDLGAYVTLATTQTISGAKTFTLDITVNGVRVGKGAGSLSGNTALGEFSLYSNTTGNQNTGIGFGGLFSNTTGQQNTALGNVAMNTNTTGNNNTAIGFSTLISNSTGSNNTVIGSSAGSSITTGSNNTIIGTYSGTPSLANNIVLADGAGNIRYQWNGTNNVFTGAATFSSIIGVNGATEAGWSIKSNGNLKVEGGSGTTILQINDTASGGKTWSQISAGAGNVHSVPNGTFYLRNSSDGITALSVSSGANVGIGTSSPNLSTSGTALTVNASSGANAAIEISDGNTLAGLIYGRSGTGVNLWSIPSIPLIFGTNNTERMRITSGGNVGIGSTGVGIVRLHVKGVDSTSANIAFGVINSNTSDLFYLRNDGYINTGTLAAAPYNLALAGRSMIVDSIGGIGYLVSTRESKANIESIKNVDFINQLNPVQFNYRKKDNITNTFTDELEENITYGFIADEVEKVNKDLVFYDNLMDGTKKLAGVEYNNMIAILTKAVQELEARIKQLENK